MLQSFSVKSERTQIAPRLALLRERLLRESVDAFLVPRADAWGGEWVQPKDERLSWLSGFSGSAGMAVVGVQHAALFVDGRYDLQALQETDLDAFEVLNVSQQKPIDWLLANLPKGARIAVDPWLTTLEHWESWQQRSADVFEWSTLSRNPIDEVRGERPSGPAQALEVHPDAFSGRSSAEKRAEIAQILYDKGAGAALITAADSLAWLLNIRGHLIRHAPVVHGFALLYQDKTVDLWLPEPPSTEVQRALGEEVRLCDLSTLQRRIETFANKIIVHRSGCPIALLPNPEEKEKWIIGSDPCAMPMTCKTQAELMGAKRAHEIDATAMVRFLAWFDQRKTTLPAPTEIEIVQQLESFRRENVELRDISFETICGSGPNAAIVHYRVNEATNREIGADDVVLVDSGGQYPFGTTDITRVLAGRATSPDVTRAYTRVLQGLIALSSLRFPKGLAGRDIDAVARAPLWREGWDYNHGTGHGVGSYLSVHEGPQSLHRRNTVPLMPGMILSIEPGYYRAGEFGIRLENLVRIQEVEAEQGREMLGFATLTYVPFERRLIQLDLLTSFERAWIDSYHLRCREIVFDHLIDSDRKWVLHNTAALAQ